MRLKTRFGLNIIKGSRMGSRDTTASTPESNEALYLRKQVECCEELIYVKLFVSNAKNSEE